MAAVISDAAIGGSLTLAPLLRTFLDSRRRAVLLSCAPASSSYSTLSGRHRLPRGAFPLRLTAAATRKKDNVWSIDNDAAEAEAKSPRFPARRRRRRQRRTSAGKGNWQKKGGRILVSGRLLVEVETVLQTQEPVIKPAWDTFASSISGVWKGVGAVFSPMTAEMEPVGLGVRDEQCYDCYTLTHVQRTAVETNEPGIMRKTNWAIFNPFGENKRKMGADSCEEFVKGKSINSDNTGLPSYESFDLVKSEVLEEEVMLMDPGLIFFEDGSYSRGPVDLPVGEYDESRYYLSPTFKFEQCLVKGCHKRLRIVHTIEFNEGGATIQIVRVALYEEQWARPSNIEGLDVENDLQFELKPFSERKRTETSDLIGSWKVFEVSATPIFSEGAEADGASFVYLCTETLKKRSLPESSVLFGEEEMLDMQDATVLWLPGGVTGYVDVDKDGNLCIGVGWYSDEGVNLVMEREYGPDGKLKDVRWKTEVKRRWNEPVDLYS